MSKFKFGQHIYDGTLKLNGVITEVHKEGYVYVAYENSTRGILTNNTDKIISLKNPKVIKIINGNPSVQFDFECYLCGEMNTEQRTIDEIINMAVEQKGNNDA